VSRSLSKPGPASLIGPWTRWVRDPADLFRLSFLLGAAILLAVGQYGEALRLVLTFAVCLIPRLIGSALAFDLAFGAAMSLQAWGNVSRVFWSWPFYHDLVHLVLTMATAALVYFVLVFLRLVPDLSQETGAAQKLGIAVLAFALGSTVNAVYEEYERIADHLLGAHLLENYHHDVHDLFFGGLGSVAAGLWMGLWSARRWSTRRAVEDDPLAQPRLAIERRITRAVRESSGPRARSRHRRERVSTPTLPPVSDRGFRLLLGDWSQPLRDVNDLARMSLLVGLVLSGLSGNGDHALRFGLTFMVSAAVRRLDAPRAFELAFTGALLFEAWGDFSGAFGSIPGFEDWTNFALSLATAPILYLVLIRLGVFPEFADEPGVHRRIALFIAATCLGFCAGIYYEQYVWLANHHLGAGIPTSWNSLTRHLALDVGGSCAGAAMLVARDVCGWGTRRRAAHRARAST
jgi:hypothetical protein